MSKNNRNPAIYIAILVSLLALTGTWFAPARIQPVQAAVITPIAQTARDTARVATFWNNEVVIADTRRCFDLGSYEVMDLQYVANATLANTTTVTLQQTNMDPAAANPTPVYNAADAIATVVSTDASAFAQVGLFGRWNCVNVDVTNANPLTLTIIGVAK